MDVSPANYDRFSWFLHEITLRDLTDFTVYLFKENTEHVSAYTALENASFPLDAVCWRRRSVLLMLTSEQLKSTFAYAQRD